MQSKMIRVFGVLGVLTSMSVAAPVSVALADEEPSAEDTPAAGAASPAKSGKGESAPEAADVHTPLTGTQGKEPPDDLDSGEDTLGAHEDLDVPVVDDRARDERPMLGVAFRARQIFLPEQLVELFVAQMPGSESHLGYGVEFFRKKGSFTFAIGFEYDKLAAAEGVWVDKGDTIPAAEADLVEFDDFSWYAIDLSFIWQTQLGRYFAIRYGTGFGVGFVQGEVLRTDLRCTSEDPASCQPYAGSLNDRTPDPDVPPVLPVINMLLGVQFRPIENVALNLEAGFRSVPFAGTSLAVMF